jgi:hypothetical protein
MVDYEPTHEKLFLLLNNNILLIFNFIDTAGLDSAIKSMDFETAMLLKSKITQDILHLQYSAHSLYVNENQILAVGSSIISIITQHNGKHVVSDSVCIKTADPKSTIKKCIVPINSKFLSVLHSNGHLSVLSSKQ